MSEFSENKKRLDKSLSVVRESESRIKNVKEICKHWKIPSNEYFEIVRKSLKRDGFDEESANDTLTFLFDNDNSRYDYYLSNCLSSMHAHKTEEFIDDVTIFNYFVTDIRNVSYRCQEIIDEITSELSVGDEGNTERIEAAIETYMINNSLKGRKTNPKPRRNAVKRSKNSFDFGKRFRKLI